MGFTVRLLMCRAVREGGLPALRVIDKLRPRRLAGTSAHPVVRGVAAALHPHQHGVGQPVRQHRARGLVPHPPTGQLVETSCTSWAGIRHSIVVCLTSISPSAGRTAPMCSRNAWFGPMTSTPVRESRSRKA